MIGKMKTNIRYSVLKSKRKAEYRTQECDNKVKMKLKDLFKTE